jgi:hypothetical protein
MVFFMVFNSKKIILQQNQITDHKIILFLINPVGFNFFMTLKTHRNSTKKYLKRT